MITNKQVIQIYEGLAELYSLNADLNIITNFYLARNKVILEPIYWAICATKQQLLKKYSDTNGTIEAGKMPALTTELENLMSVENDIDLDLIPLVDLAHTKIGISLIEKLLPIIKE